jgi:hypothetical protein
MGAMGQVWHAWGHVILVSAGCLPIVAVIAWWESTRRGEWRGPVAEIGIVAGTLPWLWMILTPRSGERALAPIPLLSLRDVLFPAGSPGFAPDVSALVVEVGGNLLALAALGLLLPVRFRAMAGVLRVGAVAAALSVLVETAQFTLDLGRVSAVDDVLLNTAGACIAALLSRRYWATRRSTAGPAYAPTRRPR